MSTLAHNGPVLPVSRPLLSTGMRWAISSIGFVLLVIVIIGGLRIATDPVRFPVLNVDVDGTLDYTDREQLRELVETHTGKGFYGMDVDAIRESVESLPWVSTAHISRMWPGRLMVDVEEHEPAARYNNNALVSKSMEVFEPPQLQRDNPQYLDWQASFAGLPRLSGADGRHQAVLDAFRFYSQQLAATGSTIDSLLEDERRSQTLVLNNDVTVRLGYESRELRLQRFLDVYERLVTPLNGRPARFDMRYSNGFALSGGLPPARNGL